MFDRIKGVFSRLLKKDSVVIDRSYVVRKIQQFKSSSRYRDMLEGERYFKGEHNILRKQRTVIGVDGTPTVVTNLPNNRIVDNQYRKMVIQKANYLLGQPISFKADDDKYSGELSKVFNKRFNRVLKNVGEDSLNCGIGYVFIDVGDDGGIKFTRLKPYEVIPVWEDSDHERLEKVIRIFSVTKDGKNFDEVVEKVEVYSNSGIDYYEYYNGALKPVEPSHEDYFSVGENSYSWQRVPIIPFKYNSNEIPLIKMVKSLQDGMNEILSAFNTHQEIALEIVEEWA